MRAVTGRPDRAPARLGGLLMSAPMLTVFSIPKGFVDPHVSLIQRNAIASWRNLGPEVEVLYMGDDPGVAEVAAEHGATHVG